MYRDRADTDARDARGTRRAQAHHVVLHRERAQLLSGEQLADARERREPWFALRLRRRDVLDGDDRTEESFDARESEQELDLAPRGARDERDARMRGEALDRRARTGR